MELLLTGEQSMLRDAASTFAQRRGGAHRLRNLKDQENDMDREVLREAADAGWIAVLVPEKKGGLGLGLTELCLISEEVGKALIPEPIGAGAAIATALPSGSLEAVISGKSICGLALSETSRAVGDEPPNTIAEHEGTNCILSGVKTGIPYATDADGFLISAGGTEGPTLAYAERNETEITTTATVDGGSHGVLALNRTPAIVISRGNECTATVALLLDALHISGAAELLGIMEAAQDLTIEYLKTRQQFDRPIGSFQALQHKAVDNLAAIEMCRSLIYQSAGSFDRKGVTPGLASATLSRAITSALNICKSAVQMHGGIGFTEEHDIGLYLKRALSLSARYGTAGLHRKRYAEQAGT